MGQDHKPATMQNDGVGNPSIGGIKELQDNKFSKKTHLKHQYMGKFLNHKCKPYST